MEPTEEKLLKRRSGERSRLRTTEGGGVNTGYRIQTQNKSLSSDSPALDALSLSLSELASVTGSNLATGRPLSRGPQDAQNYRRLSVLTHDMRTRSDASSCNRRALAARKVICLKNLFRKRDLSEKQRAQTKNGRIH